MSTNRKAALATGATRYEGQCGKHGAVQRTTCDNRCVVCTRERQRARRGWKWATPEAKMLESARRRSREKGLACTITLSDIVIPETCPVLGTPLHTNKRERGANSPSLDRVDNRLGYVPGNVCVISWRANNIKSDATVEELEAIARYLSSWKS